MIEFKGNMYPNFVWMFVFFNLVAWVWKGNPLFSWWYIVIVFGLQLFLEITELMMVRYFMATQYIKQEMKKK